MRIDCPPKITFGLLACGLIASITFIESGVAQIVSGAAIDGTDRFSAPTIECRRGNHGNEHLVSENSVGQYKHYNTTGSHRFDASSAVFNGLDTNNNALQHWPIGIKVANPIDRVFAFRAKSLAVGETGRSQHVFPISIPQGLDSLHFFLRFDAEDFEGRVQMRLTTPNGSHKIYKNAQRPFQSAVINSPSAGQWTVHAIAEGNEASVLDYTLRVDDDPTIELEKTTGVLQAKPNSHIYRYHTITVPDGLDKVHFFTRFHQADKNSFFIMKITDPSGVETYRNQSKANFESAIIQNPIGGEWMVRISKTKEFPSELSYTLTVSNDIRHPTAGCWTGGLIKGAWDENGFGVKRLNDRRRVTWEYPYHHSAGMTLEMDNFLVENVTIINHGDGIKSNGDGNTIDGAYLADIHDDCIENDRLGNLLVTDSFLDGCYVAFSARAHKAGYDGSENLFEIKNSLVRLEPQPTVYKPQKYGPGPGHGIFFKWNSSRQLGIKLSVHNSIFLATQLPRHGRGLGVEDVGNLESCSNNVIVWTGAGVFPNRGNLPSCFRVTTDFSEWTEAVSAWRARHPGRPAHP